MVYLSAEYGLNSLSEAIYVSHVHLIKYSSSAVYSLGIVRWKSDGLPELQFAMVARDQIVARFGASYKSKPLNSSLGPRPLPF